MEILHLVDKSDGHKVGHKVESIRKLLRELDKEFINLNKDSLLALQSRYPAESERIGCPAACSAGTDFAVSGLMISALGGAPLLLALPTNRYVFVHQFLVSRFDPFMPIYLIIGLVVNTILAVAASTALALSAAAVALLVRVVVVSLTKILPINGWVSTLDAAAIPLNWERLDPRVW